MFGRRIINQYLNRRPVADNKKFHLVRLWLSPAFKIPAPTSHELLSFAQALGVVYIDPGTRMKEFLNRAIVLDELIHQFVGTHPPALADERASALA
jgi:hypothetical protein